MVALEDQSFISSKGKEMKIIELLLAALFTLLLVANANAQTMTPSNAAKAVEMQAAAATPNPEQQHNAPGPDIHTGAMQPVPASAPAPAPKVPITLDVNGVGTLHPASDITAEESAWLGLLETRMILQLIDHADIDTVGFVKQHDLQRHFISAEGVYDPMRKWLIALAVLCASLAAVMWALWASARRKRQFPD